MAAEAVAGRTAAVGAAGTRAADMRAAAADRTPHLTELLPRIRADIGGIRFMAAARTAGQRERLAARARERMLQARTRLPDSRQGITLGKNRRRTRTQICNLIFTQTRIPERRLPIAGHFTARRAMEIFRQPVYRRMIFDGVRSYITRSIRSVLGMDMGIRLDLASALVVIHSGTSTVLWATTLVMAASDTAAGSDTAATLVITAARQDWDTAADRT